MNKIAKKMFGQKGFTLPEVMLAVALMGGMSLIVSQVVKQTAQVKRSSETNANSFATIYEIQNIFKDKEACAINLQGKLPGVLTEIKNRNGMIRYEVSKEYDNGTIRLSNANFTRNGNETLVNIFVEKIGNKKEMGLNTAVIRKSIPINAEYDDTGRLLSCQSDIRNHVEEAVATALEKICSGLNLSYDSSAKRCYAKPQLGTNTSIICPPGKSVVAFQLNTGEYVTDCEDALGMQGTCNNNQLLRRNADKTYSCVDITCPGSGVFIGLKDDGTANCMTCADGTSLMFANGVLQCSRPACYNASGTGQFYMAGIDSDGQPVCNKLVDDSAANCDSGKLTVRPDGSLAYECCTPNCSDSANYCSGSNYPAANGCGQCTGTKPVDCSDAADHCSGTSYTAKDNCGLCTGTRAPKNATWSEWSACVDGKRTRTCSNDQVCGGASCEGPSMEVCEPETPPAPKGVCQGSGYDSSLFKMAYQEEVQNGCRTQYRDVYMDIDVNKFKKGNIYYIGQGSQFTAEVLDGDTPRSVLQRIADKINNQKMTYPTLCNGAGSTVVTTATVVSNNRLKYHINWQHQPAMGGSWSCNIDSEDACKATPGCSWNTTSANVCVGWNYPAKVGTCQGTYYKEGCGWDGYTGSESNKYECQYGYSDASSCNAQWSKGCRWGSFPQTCYAGSEVECKKFAGCSWKAYPDEHKSCTAASWETACKEQGAGYCTWRPREQ